MSEVLFQILDRELPDVPPYVGEIIEKLSSPQSANIKEITDAIGQSRALTNTILNMLNTGYFGIVRRVDSLETAVLMIGMDSLRYIILGLIVKMLFNKRETVPSVSGDAFLRHCLGTAIASQLLCEASRISPQCDKYKLLTYGMLHDIGILALDYSMPFTLNRIHNLAVEEKIPILRAEAKVFGRLTHDVVGHWVCRRWKLPEDIAHVVMYHHKPRQSDGFKQEVALYYIADMISMSYYETLLENDYEYSVDQKMLEFLGITQQDVDEVEAVLPEEVEKAMRVIDFRTLDKLSFD